MVQHSFHFSQGQYGLLTTLPLNPNLDQNSLARELGIDRTNVADVLNRLAGACERRQGPCIGRRSQSACSSRGGSEERVI